MATLIIGHNPFLYQKHEQIDPIEFEYLIMNSSSLNVQSAGVQASSEEIID